MKNSTNTPLPFLESTNPGNRSLSLRLLLALGPLSRTDIAKYLHITTAAVTAISSDLLEMGLLVQLDTASTMPADKTGAGRKKAPLAINANWKYILAIDIHSYYINIAIVNLMGDVIAEQPSYFPENTQPDHFCENIAQNSIRLLWTNGITTEQILGAGITIIGPVNQIEGIALHPFRLFEDPLPVRTLFKKYFPFPIAVESNVCASLEGEMLYTDLLHSSQNILMLKWGPGVGSAMAIGGRIYKGYGFQSTEIGHNQITEKNGLKCNCGHYGCLEPSISADAIVSYILRQVETDPDGTLAALQAQFGPPSRQNLSPYLLSNDETLWAFLDQCVHDLAKVTNNALHILAPNRLILTGDLFAFDKLAERFEKQLLLRNPQLPPDLCRRAQMSGRSKYIGAAAAAVSQILLAM